MGSHRLPQRLSSDQIIADIAAGRTFLHHAAAFGFEDCIDVLLSTPGINVGAADGKGLLPLHYAAVHAQPMCAYNLAKAAPQTCLEKDNAGQTPTDAAAECDKGEVCCV